MIVQAHATAPLAYPAAVAQVYQLASTGRLDPAATGAVADEQAVLVRAGLAVLTQRVEVAFLKPVLAPTHTHLGIRWLASGPTESNVPVLDANLELRPADEHRTDIGVIGSYEAPGGRPATVVDHLLLRRVAESTVEQFLRQVVALLSVHAAEHGGGQGRIADIA